jgi:hypothetical protein
MIAAMRMIPGLVLVLVLGCGGAGKPGPAPAVDNEGTSADEATPSSPPGRYCTADGLCYEEVSRDDYASDDELMCAQYCTAYCACYEEVEGEDCHDGGGCVMACEQDLSKESGRVGWLRRLRCGQEADCMRFLDEC